MSIYSVCNIKGGAGKTTTAIHLTRYLVKNNCKTALIDGDWQQSCSAWANSVESLNGLEIFNSSDIDEIEDQILEYSDNYDAVVIDTPGNSEEMVRIIPSLSDWVVIPLSPSPLDVTSSDLTIKQIARARRRSGKYINTLVFMNQVVKNTNLARDTRELFVNYDHIDFSSTEIPFAQLMAKLPSQGKTVFDSNNKVNHKLANLYSELFSNLIEVKA